MDAQVFTGYSTVSRLFLPDANTTGIQANTLNKTSQCTQSNPGSSICWKNNSFYQVAVEKMVFASVCICVYMYIFMGYVDMRRVTHTCVCARACACGGQRATYLSFLRYYLPCFLRQDLTGLKLAK